MKEIPPLLPCGASNMSFHTRPWIYIICWDSGEGDGEEAVMPAFKHTYVEANSAAEAYTLGGRAFNDDLEIKGKMLNDYVIPLSWSEWSD